MSPMHEISYMHCEKKKVLPHPTAKTPEKNLVGFAQFVLEIICWVSIDLKHTVVECKFVHNLIPNEEPKLTNE